MAELASLLNVNFKNSSSMEDWALNNSGDHLEIQQEIQARGGSSLPVRELYPLNLRDWQAFALRHQTVHNEMNAVLGLEGSDLTSVNFDDPKDVSYWNNEHFLEHKAARQKLGI